jgi:hypothetical protein
MIKMGEKLEKSAFRPLFIYNSYENAYQEQAVLPPVLRWNIAYSGSPLFVFVIFYLTY